MKFYKRDPDRALAGMAELTLQERGAYNTILDALYSRDGVLRDDDDLLKRLMGCHGNEWRAVKPKLIAAGKVWIEDGYIKAKGVDSTLKEAENFSETQRKRAENRWEIERKTAGNSEKVQQNQQSADAKAKMPLTPIEIDTPKEKKGCAIAQPEGYAFEGMVVRLKSADFEKWRDAYAGGDESVLRAWLQQRDDWLVSPDAETGRRAKWFVTTSNWLATKAGERNGHGSDAKAETAGSEGRVERVSERLKARFGQGISECPGRDDDPVLPAVQGIH